MWGGKKDPNYDYGMGSGDCGGLEPCRIESRRKDNCTIVLALAANSYKKSVTKQNPNNCILCEKLNYSRIASERIGSWSKAPTLKQILGRQCSPFSRTKYPIQISKITEDKRYIPYPKRYGHRNAAS